MLFIKSIKDNHSFLELSVGDIVTLNNFSQLSAQQPESYDSDNHQNDAEYLFNSIADACVSITYSRDCLNGEIKRCQIEISR
mgnify:CR=1 FL=1